MESAILWLDVYCQSNKPMEVLSAPNAIQLTFCCGQSMDYANVSMVRSSMGSAAHWLVA